RAGRVERPLVTWAGVGIAALYVVIWVFNGKRSQSVFGVLTGICAYYVSRFRRPRLPMLAATGLAGAVVVTLAIGWRNNHNYELSASGFLNYLADFDPSAILVNLNLKTRYAAEPFKEELASHETEEYCGYLLMMDTVPEKASY